jgi:hypothetical protein
MSLNSLLIILQAENIKEKIKNAPDGGYEIGVVIGTYLPFVLLVVLAYIIYYRMKNRKDLDE